MQRCPACGKVVPRGRGFKSDRRYCNYVCYRKFPPSMVKVQETFGQPIKEVLLEHINKNKSPEITAGLLGINRSTLYQWMDKLGIKKVLYYE